MPPIVSHPAKARVHYRRLNAEKVDFVQVDDSNGEHQNTGWSRARRRALASRHAQFAGEALDFMSGSNWSAENHQFGFGSGDTGVVSTGAPAALNTLLNPAIATRGGTYPLRYGYWPSAGYTGAVGLNLFVQYNSAHSCNFEGETLEWHLSYGTFDSGSGSFRPCVQKPGGAPLAQLATINTNTGAVGVQWGVLSFSYSGQSDLRFHPVAPNGTVLVNPVWLGWQRLVRTSVTAGFGSGMFVVQGGDGARQFARVLGVADGADGPDSLGSMSAAQFDHSLDALTRGQGSNVAMHNMVVILRSSFNDVNPTNTRLSVGGSPAASNTAAGYYDNLGAVYDYWHARWAATGRDPARLGFELAPGHPLDPDTSALLDCVTQCKDFSAAHAGCWTLDQRAVVTGAQLTARQHGGAVGGIVDEHLNHVPNATPGDGVSNAYDYYEKLMLDGLFAEIAKSPSSPGGARRLFLLGGLN